MLVDVRHKAECFTLKWIDAFFRDRKLYVGLWFLRLRAGKKKKGCWSAAQRELKREIVKRRTFEQLISFRALAEAIYVRQRALLKKALAETSNPFKRSKLESELMDLNIGEMSDVDWSKLRSALVLADLGDDALHAAAAATTAAASSSKPTLSPDYVRQDIAFELKGLSVQLLDEACLRPTTRVVLSRVAASYRGLEDGTSYLGAFLGSLEMVCA